MVDEKSYEELDQEYLVLEQEKDSVYKNLLLKILLADEPLLVREASYEK